MTERNAQQLTLPPSSAERPLDAQKPSIPPPLPFGRDASIIRLSMESMHPYLIRLASKLSRPSGSPPPHLPAQSLTRLGRP